MNNYQIYPILAAELETREKPVITKGEYDLFIKVLKILYVHELKLDHKWVEAQEYQEAQCS